MKKEFIKKVSFGVLSIFLILSGCTKKKNTVGIPNGNIQPIETILGSDLIENNYSFEDSCRNYSDNTTLLVGSYHNSQAYSLLRFDNFPDTLSSVEGDVKLNLYLKNKINEENIALQFGKIDENWMENKATWTAATDSTDWNSPGDFFSEITPPNWTIIDDSIEVTLPTDLLQNWLESDSTNFGLVIYSSADNSFLEINSSETENAPRLIFDYKKTADDSIQTYSAAPVSDTFIYSTDNNFTKFENQLIVANIQPTKMFIKFNLSDTIFINMENSGIGNSDDFRRMTINRAELVFHKLDENYYLAGDELTLRPYPVLTANPSIPFTYGDDYEYLTGSSADSLNNDEISVDVTEIVQKITSGDYENNGLLLKSTFENKDFSHIEFAPKDYNDEAWRPYLKIIYTPPYLDE